VTVRGRVVGPAGKPVAQALVFCRLHVWAGDHVWRFPLAVRDGVFELGGLDPDKTYPAYILAPKERWGAAVTLSGKQAGGVVTVRLGPCGEAKLRLVTPDGKPVAGMRVMPALVVTPGTHSFYAFGGDPAALYADEGLLANLDRLNYWDGPHADAAGRCTLPALVPGATYVLAAYEKGRWTAREFTVEAGRTRDLGDVVVKGPD
jgi:hypothetical protein